MWYSTWSITKCLFLLNRYSVFVDPFIYMSRMYFIELLFQHFAYETIPNSYDTSNRVRGDGIYLQKPRSTLMNSVDIENLLSYNSQVVCL